DATAGASWKGAAAAVPPRDAIVPGGRDSPRVEPFRLDREAHLVALEHSDEAVGVVRVRMGQRDDVDTAGPRRKARPKLCEESTWVGTAVDEERPSGDLDQERIALTDVERPDPQDRARQDDHGRRRAEDDREPHGGPER